MTCWDHSNATNGTISEKQKRMAASMGTKSTIKSKDWVCSGVRTNWRQRESMQEGKQKLVPRKSHFETPVLRYRYFTIVILDGTIGGGVIAIKVIENWVQACTTSTTHHLVISGTTLEGKNISSLGLTDQTLVFDDILHLWESDYPLWYLEVLKYTEFELLSDDFNFCYYY